MEKEMRTAMLQANKARKVDSPIARKQKRSVVL